MLDGSPVRCVLLQGIVNAVFVIVNVVTDQSVKMLLVQRDDMVQELSPAASDPSFRNSILPRRLYDRPFGLQSSGLQKRDHFLSERRISIEDEGRSSDRNW